MYSKASVVLALAAAVAADLAPRQTAAPSTTAAAAAEVTAITDCHLHGSELFCFADETEYLVHSTPTATTDVPAEFTGCHQHDSEMFCVDADGEDVEIEIPAADGEEDHDHEHEGEEEHDHEEEEGDASSGKENCHFHAGVEHCTGGESSSESTCEAPKRDYKIGLRVGLLFAIMATSTIGVFGPIMLQKILPNKLTLVFTILKQFGTGIIISTAFIHLYTHATLMFANSCLGELDYEGTSAAILMAGIFLSFAIEYAGKRVVLAKVRAADRMGREEQAKAMLSTEVVSILVMECGVLFHSLLIGLTLVVADDSFFLTLFVVILFHQMFEGIALGTRIATVGSHSDDHIAPLSSNPSDADKSTSSSGAEEAPSKSISGTTLSMTKKLGLAALFSFITPIGMAIGIGVLGVFNANDKSTIVAIGTLDALSAGILVWVGVVEMWAADWMTGAHGRKAELSEANILTVFLAGTGLIAGLVVMSLLGKWA